MKKSILSLLICAAVTCSAYAEIAPANVGLAQEGVTYTAIVIKLKPSKPLLKSTATTATTTSHELSLSDPSLVPTRMFRSNKLRSTQSDELAKLDATYGFDRYMRVELPENKSQDQNYINRAIAELEQNPDVELVYAEPMPISLDEYRHDNTSTPALLKSVGAASLTASAVPDFRNQQDYLKSATEKRPGYYMGGVGRESLNGYAGSDGTGITIISSENCAWNTDHINLPTMSLLQGDSSWVPSCGEHDSASVGIMAGRDIGAGIRGFTWNSKVGYAGWQTTNMYNMIPLLKAGDVVQVGMQAESIKPAGCTKDCLTPWEAQPAFFDITKALTDKGVYVIAAAGNGNVNLDDPLYNGKFDLSVKDSGAIIVGAMCAKDGKRAYFSSYGSRVTSAAWGCWDVVTTGGGDLYKDGVNTYTQTFSGTSSANPIIAGVVASLSGIAKANGITVTPKQMRQILQETGTPLANGDSAKIGTYPDMERAVARIMALKSGGDTTLPAPTAVAGADYTMVSPATGVSTWPLDGSKSLNATSYNWSVTKGSGTFWLQEKLNGTLVSSVNSANAWAVIPANTEGEVTYTLTTTGADGRTAQDSMTIKVSKPAAPALDAPAYNAKIAYPTKCTKVSYDGKIWMNQWYVNPGQETPGNGGSWGVWRQQGATGNSCK
ncbi:S8 family serine peptidase [Leclercia sp. AS011]|uniref:S8 family serine peptidase n=1 Tax=Leclercia sp. AS011 TaxID=3081257 RepID=UPI003018249B